MFNCCGGTQPSHLVSQVTRVQLTGVLLHNALLKSAIQWRTHLKHPHYRALQATTHMHFLKCSLYSKLTSLAILSALDQTKEEACNRVKTSPITIQRLSYAVCILHGFLQTQRIYPNTGLNHLLETSPMQLNQVMSGFYRTKLLFFSILKLFKLNI